MPLVKKEVIRPGTYWYQDQKTGKPRKLVVTAEDTRHWHDQGNKMLGAGLTVPVPYEHDFGAHPMTPKDKLLNNSGWVQQYEMAEDGKLMASVDVQDEEVARKLPRTIRWTSPWINSFTDGAGREWKNVISHLALTTRPRIVNQDPFPSIAAALSLATPDAGTSRAATQGSGVCLSRAGLLVKVGADGDKLRPRYPLAFSLLAGARFAADDVPFGKKPRSKPGDKDAASGSDPLADPPLGADNPGADEDAADGLDLEGLANPVNDGNGDIKMEELLCDLLQALGVPMPDQSNEQEFRRHLYEAVMSKVKELTSKGMGAQDPGKMPPDQNKPPTQQPNAAQPNNPVMPQVQAEQQPMYMSLEEINKIEDGTMRTVALSMYHQNEELRKKLEVNERTANAMRDSKIAEATKKRADRVRMLGRLAPKAKDDLEAMLSLQGNALAMDDAGNIVDPMRATLDMLEKGLANMPQMLTTDHTALTLMPHPTDADALSTEGEAALVDSFSRMMGCAPTAG